MANTVLFLHRYTLLKPSASKRFATFLNEVVNAVFVRLKCNDGFNRLTGGNVDVRRMWAEPTSVGRLN